MEDFSFSFFPPSYSFVCICVFSKLFVHFKVLRFAGRESKKPVIRSFPPLLIGRRAVRPIACECEQKHPRGRRGREVSESSEDMCIPRDELDIGRPGPVGGLGGCGAEFDTVSSVEWVFRGCLG